MLPVQTVDATYAVELCRRADFRLRPLTLTCATITNLRLRPLMSTCVALEGSSHVEACTYE
jgi:hypothetical protein